jgi:rhodanese-related sulfurtransferase
VNSSRDDNARPAFKLFLVSSSPSIDQQTDRLRPRAIALSSCPMPIPIQGPLSSDEPVRTIERDELQRKVEPNDPRFKLVMALADWEFRTKHIPGSLHFKDASDMLSALRKDDEIVVYCTNPPCLASVAAYHRLVQEGYTNVRRYAGGVEDWEAAGLPLERGAA